FSASWTDAHAPYSLSAVAVHLSVICSNLWAAFLGTASLPVPLLVKRFRILVPFLFGRQHVFISFQSGLLGSLQCLLGFSQLALKVAPAFLFYRDLLSGFVRFQF